MPAGFLLINRSIKCNEDYKCLLPVEKRIFMELLFMANFNEGREKRCRKCRKKIILEIGQIFGSIKDLCVDLEISYSKGYRKLNRIKECNLIDIQTESCHTIITVNNYSKICGYEKANEKEIKPECNEGEKSPESLYIYNTFYNNKRSSKCKTSQNINRYSLPLVNYLREAILSKYHTHNIAGTKWTSIKKGWVTQADRLLRLDGDGGRPFEQCKEIIDWVFNESDFWAPNIQSMATFRKQYDKLLANMNRDQGFKPQYELNWADPNS